MLGKYVETRETFWFESTHYVVESLGICKNTGSTVTGDVRITVFFLAVYFPTLFSLILGFASLKYWYQVEN